MAKFIGMFKSKKLPLILNSPFRRKKKKKDTEKRLSDIGKNIPVFWFSNSSFKIRIQSTSLVVPIYMFFTAHLSGKGCIPHWIQSNRTFKNIIVNCIILDFRFSDQPTFTADFEVTLTLKVGKFLQMPPIFIILIFNTQKTSKLITDSFSSNYSHNFCELRNIAITSIFTFQGQEWSYNTNIKHKSIRRVAYKAKYT